MRETEKIWMNGELVDWADAKVHVGAHGLHYGSGVFEGIRCYETEKGPAVFRLTDHLRRLHDSARLLQMELPYSVDELRAATNELLAANGLPECYIRPIAFYGFGQLGVAADKVEGALAKALPLTISFLASLLGLDIARTYKLVFTSGALIAGLAGALISPMLSVDPYIGNVYLVRSFFVVTVGGLGELLGGTLIGAFLIGGAETIIALASSQAFAQTIVFALAVVLLRYVFAIGSNEEATRLSGVRTVRWKASAYIISGFFAGLAGVVIAARLNSAQPAVGFGYELDAIAAAVIGGTSLSGGEGSILGTVIGAFLISVLTNGLRLLDVPQEWQIVVTGVIVVLAVYLDIVRRRRQA